MASEQSKVTTETATSAAEDCIELAKRAFALRNYEQAVEHYAIALEIMTKKHGDASPECVDLYFAYGKALLENAIAQNTVLGKEETGDEMDNIASGSDRKTSGRIVFGEDEQTDEGNGEEPTVDLFAEASRPEPEPTNDEHEEEEEPEDDFNAAWEVLEVARSLYEAQKDANDDIKLKLADTYIALGDISLETEKLEQAAADFKSAAQLKEMLLPKSSRQLAEVHYKLSIVYDMTPGRLSQAIEEAAKARASVQARLDEIKTRLATENESKPDIKGKGKADYITETSLHEMSKAQLEGELDDLRGLLEEVSLRIEELKTSPNQLGDASAPDLVARELDRDLNSAQAGSSSASKQVNDLTSIVKKKRKAPEPTDEGDSNTRQKKTKSVE